MIAVQYKVKSQVMELISSITGTTGLDKPHGSICHSHLNTQLNQFIPAPNNVTSSLTSKDLHSKAVKFADKKSVTGLRTTVAKSVITHL